MDVPGENLKGVYSANEYLTRVNLMGAWGAGQRHARSCTASASSSSAAATWRWTPSAPPAASAPTRRHRLPPRSRRAARPRRGGPPRRAGGHPLRLPRRAARGPRRREPLGDRAALPPDGARRARRVRPPPAGADPRLRVRHRLRHGHRRHRHAGQPAADARPHPDLDGQRVGLHRDRRARHDEPARRVRRRRHRARRGHGHPRDGRRQALAAAIDRYLTTGSASDVPAAEGSAATAAEA